MEVEAMTVYSPEEQDVMVAALKKLGINLVSSEEIEGVRVEGPRTLTFDKKFPLSLAPYLLYKLGSPHRATAQKMHRREFERKGDTLLLEMIKIIDTEVSS